MILLYRLRDIVRNRRGNVWGFISFFMCRRKFHMIRCQIPFWTYSQRFSCILLSFFCFISSRKYIRGWWVLWSKWRIILWWFQDLISRGLRIRKSFKNYALILWKVYYLHIKLAIIFQGCNDAIFSKQKRIYILSEGIMINMTKLWNKSTKSIIKYSLLKIWWTSVMNDNWEQIK